MVSSPRRGASALVPLVLLAACAAPVFPSSTPSDGGATATAAVDRLADRVAASHPDPWFGIAESDFWAAAANLRERIASLAAEEQVTELMRLAAMIGTEGRNAHMVALPDAPPGSHRLPVGVHLFADGLHVVEADAAHAELVGARVDSVGGMPVAEAMDRLRPLVNRDNRHTVDWVLPLFLESPTVLAGAGIVPDPSRVELGLVMPDGGSRTVTLEPIPTGPYADLLETFVSLRLPAREGLTWLSDQASELWMRPLPHAGALYVQYNTIWESSATYVDPLRRELRRSQADRLVLDLRLNPGGENPNYPPLLEALAMLEDDGIDLVVLIGRGTFSAATALATQIAETTDARFVGEPSAGSPTTHANVRPLRLDELALPVLVWVPSATSSVGPAGADTIEPDVAVELAAEDYFAGRDPVLEAALALPATVGGALSRIDPRPPG